MTLYRHIYIWCLIGFILAGCTLNLQSTSENRLSETVDVSKMPTVAAEKIVEQTASPDINTSQPISTSVLAISPTLAPTAPPKQASGQIQLTQGGCCVQPFFSADSNSVLFIAKSSDTVPVGIYGINLKTFISPAASPPQLVDDVIGFRSPDQSIVAFPEANAEGLMRFLDRPANESWTIDTQGYWPVIAADNQHIYWNVTSLDGPYDERPTDIWVARVNGSDARNVARIYGGGADGWFPDNQRLLITGRQTITSDHEIIASVSISDRLTIPLAKEARLRAGVISSNGTWITYLLTFSSDASNDGLWVVRNGGSHRQKLPFFGPHHWLDDETLLYIPFRLSATESFVLWRMNVKTAETRPITDPADMPINIQGGDWTVSPNGKRVVYVSASDQNLWLINLP